MTTYQSRELPIFFDRFSQPARDLDGGLAGPQPPCYSVTENTTDIKWICIVGSIVPSTIVPLYVILILIAIFLEEKLE